MWQTDLPAIRQSEVPRNARARLQVLLVVRKLQLRRLHYREVLGRGTPVGQDHFVRLNV